MFLDKGIHELQRDQFATTSLFKEAQIVDATVCAKFLSLNKAAWAIVAFVLYWPVHLAK